MGQVLNKLKFIKKKHLKFLSMNKTIKGKSRIILKMQLVWEEEKLNLTKICYLIDFMLDITF